MCIGENATSNSVGQQHFAQHLGSLIDALKAPHTRVVVVSSFWDGNQSIEAMQACSQAHQLTYVPLAKLGADASNKAIGQHANEGVASHPSNKGGLTIADAIWNSI
jgi:uncharacterized protein (DUF488 family)